MQENWLCLEIYFTVILKVHYDIYKCMSHCLTSNYHLRQEFLKQTVMFISKIPCIWLDSYLLYKHLGS